MRFLIGSHRALGGVSGVVLRRVFGEDDPCP